MSELINDILLLIYKVEQNGITAKENNETCCYVVLILSRNTAVIHWH
jgi:hypothetical protein